MQLSRNLLIPIALSVIALSVAWLTWVNQARLKRIDYLSGLAGGSEIRADPQSPTGYEDGLRILMLPENSSESYQWLLQTGQMMATGPWRLRHVDYDNAPHGREVDSPSAYRWWLAAGATVDHLWSGRSVALAVERAGLLAGPFLHLLLLLLTGVYVIRRNTFLAGILTILLLATAFPLTEVMLGGRPTSEHLSLVFALWSVLPLVTLSRPAAGRDPAKPQDRSDGFAFVLAGGFGALGLWTNLTLQAPVLIGIAASAICVSAFPILGFVIAGGRPSNWRRWGLAGGIVSLLLYLIEYFPGHLDWLDLKGNHPVFAIAWMAVGEVLCRVSAGMAKTRPKADRSPLRIAVAVLGMLLLPVLMILNSAWEFLPFSAAGTSLPGTILESNLLEWTTRHNVGVVTLATVLPFILFLPSVLSLWSGAGNPEGLARALIAWGPVGIAFGMAFFQPVWWPMATVLLVPLLVTSMSLPDSSRRRLPINWVWGALTVLVLSPGPWLHFTHARAASDPALSEAEVTALVERNLSHWLARRVGSAGANVLAPPNLSVSLIFHGGLSVLSTPYLGNPDGFVAAVRVAAATSADEAKALAESRKLTHIIIPSWDGYLDEYARIGATEESSTLMAMLHRWLPPRWLSPLSYQLPQVAGFEDDYAAIFRVVEVQDNATSLGRLAEYFLEMRQAEAAISVGQALEHSFPGDLNALVARAQIAIVQRDPAQFRSDMEQILSLLEGGMGDYLDWDRRVSLAVVLAQFKSGTIAREQVEICLEEADEESVRSLSTVLLFRFVSLVAAFNLEFADPGLHSIALQLLPEEMRVGL
ncbi:MAG: hypothetical protein R3F07_13785 [Opitutaceae bacterium]